MVASNAMKASASNLSVLTELTEAELDMVAMNELPEEGPKAIMSLIHDAIAVNSSAFHSSWRRQWERKSPKGDNGDINDIIPELTTRQTSLYQQNSSQSNDDARGSRKSATHFHCQRPSKRNQPNTRLTKHLSKKPYKPI